MLAFRAEVATPAPSYFAHDYYYCTTIFTVLYCVRYRGSGFRCFALKTLEVYIHFQRNDQRVDNEVWLHLCENGVFMEPARTASSMIAAGSCVDESE